MLQKAAVSQFNNELFKGIILLTKMHILSNKA